MAQVCTGCGTKLPFLQRIAGRSLCRSCDAERKEALRSAGEEYQTLLSQLVSDGDPAQIKAQLAPIADRAGIQGTDLTSLHFKSFESYLERALEDDYLTEDEERRMNEIADVLRIDQTTFESEFSEMMPRLFVARANDGRLPALGDAHIILKKNEVPHLETNAALMKEVVDREWRGGYRGFSFRVARGVRFHTGGVRGKSVVVGTHMEAADTGILTVTSRRAVYTGQKKTIEMPYTKLLSLNVFDDGIQVHLSNRKNPPLFRLDKGIGNAVAAAVNAACQPQLE